MIHLKTFIVLIVMSLLFTAAVPAFAQLLSDAYALAETRADIPANWEAWPQTNDNQRGESVRASDHRWMGRREKPNEVASPQNHILVSARVVASLCQSPAEARAFIEKIVVQVPPVRGSYTGAPLGDACLRSADTSYGASLHFCRANAHFMVDVGGPKGELDYPVVAEKIARAMLARAEAALVLAAGAPLTMNAHDTGVRQARGVSVTLVDEWAASAAATWQADWKAGTATLKRGTHTLQLMVGRREARLDGKPLTLPFPALRHGKDRLWCPTAVLSKMSL